jgi:hypothetical protein
MKKTGEIDPEIVLPACRNAPNHPAKEIVSL